jgi:dTMP kinase
VVFSEWNSSPLVKKVPWCGKKKKLLTPMTFSLIHATDFADRAEHQIIPPLKAGSVVLADRYMYTAFARDVARGVNREWVRNLYGFAVKPTVGFYFRVAPDEAMRRLRDGRAGFKYYEAGADVGRANDLEESFRIFQGRIIEEYERIVEEFGLAVTDASLPIEEQQIQMRKVVAAALAGAKKMRIEAWGNLTSLARESHE